MDTSPAFASLTKSSIDLTARPATPRLLTCVSCISTNLLILWHVDLMVSRSDKWMCSKIRINNSSGSWKRCMFHTLHPHKSTHMMQKGVATHTVSMWTATKCKQKLLLQIIAYFYQDSTFRSIDCYQDWYLLACAVTTSSSCMDSVICCFTLAVRSLYRLIILPVVLCKDRTGKKMVSTCFPFVMFTRYLSPTEHRNHWPTGQTTWFHRERMLDFERWIPRNSLVQ